MKKISILVLLVLTFNTTFAQSKDEVAIRGVLETQRIAWNKGDIDSYMKGYWQNDSLMFIGKSGVTYGWQNTLNNYKRGYPDTATMGKLDFTLIQFRRLSDTYYYVTGKWHLTRGMGNVSGHFTLLLRKFRDQWVIVADHSS